MMRMMDTTDKHAIAALALGRIFRMAARPEQPGDIAEYERCRSIILDALDPVADHSPNYVRDRLKGAAGD